MAITALFFCENQGLEPKNQGLEPKIPGLESMMFRIEDWVKISWCQFSRVYLGTGWRVVCCRACIQPVPGSWHMAKKQNNVGTIELYCSSIHWSYNFPDHNHSPGLSICHSFGTSKNLFTLSWIGIQQHPAEASNYSKWYITSQKSGPFRRLPFHDSRQILCEWKVASPALKSCTPR